jgi:hypothetical protein
MGFCGKGKNTRNLEVIAMKINELVIGIKVAKWEANKGKR